MKQARQLLTLALCCLCSMALTAQTFTAPVTGQPVPASGTGGGDGATVAANATLVPIPVTGDGIVGDDVLLGDIEISISHTWSSDLVIDLIAPDGSIHRLSVQQFNAAGEADAFLETAFSDFAFGNSIDVAFPPFDDVFFPSAGASNIAFGGSPMAGTWNLRILDLAGGDSGMVNEASITFEEGVDFSAPVEEVNLAGIGNINLTLTDDCGGLVIPEMVLAGDFDADGNGIVVGPEAFEITVMDGNTSNGPIVDGCGTFQYRVTLAELNAPATVGFTGDLDPDGANVDVVQDAGTSIEFTSDGAEMEVTDGGTVAVFATFVEEGTFSFSYDAVLESEIIADAWVINFEGEFVYRNTDVDPTGDLGTPDMASGKTPPLFVEPGQTLIVGIIGDGFQTGGQNSTLTISDFNFIPTPVAFDVIGFTTTWGEVTAEDKTSPTVEETPDDVQLLCVDIDDNNVSTLPSNISRCYEVNPTTGATIPGTMAMELNRRLRAGGTTPLVPLFADGCADGIEVCVNDVLVYDPEDPNCEDVVLTRTFTATEISDCPSAAGEENAPAVASYEILFVRPTLDDINDDNIDEVVEYDQCGVIDINDPNFRDNYPAPRPGDFPFLEIDGRTFNLTDGEDICNIAVKFEDSAPFETCPFTYKFFRTYTVLDWCNPGERVEFVQTVKVGDTTPPVFFGPTQDRNFDGIVDEDLIYTTNAGNQCAAYLRLDAAGVRATDNCSPNVTIMAQIFPGGDLSATPIGSFVVDPTDGDAEITSAIPVGCHILRYTSTDDCDNVTVSDFDFCVEDGTAPVAICEDGLNVGISSGSAAGGVATGIAVLTPEMIDNGSYDDCSGVTLAIARVNNANVATETYDQELILTCADLGIVRVGLRVTDALGNENFCWLDVLVEDKVAPTCIPPGPVRISCIEYNETLPADITESTVDERNAVFGSAAGVDNCEVTITETISGDVNSCGVGSFTRTFTTTDGQGFTNTTPCRQRITVFGIHNYQLIFPTDEEAGCATIPDYDEIAANELACDLITTTVDVDTLRTLEAGDECFKLRVTYDVINWCEYGTLGQPYLIPRDGDGIRNPETQLLYLNVLPVDVNTTTDDFAFLSRFSDRNFNSNDRLLDDGDDNDGTDDDNGNDNIDDDAYAADASRGHFRYIQFVKVYDEVAPTIDADAPADCFAGNSAECEADITLTFTAMDECSDVTPLLQLDANYVAANGFSPDSPAALGIGISLDDSAAPNYTITATNVPVGNHAIRIRVNDGCGNFDVEILEFCVAGDKAPTPICIQTLTVTLMPDGNGGGMAEIWASDFIASDVEDCFGNVIDKYAIYRESDPPAGSPSATQLGIDFDCDDVDQDIPVRVYAIADNGTADYCSVIVEVQAFQDGVCEGGDGNILSGAITTAANEAVEGVAVSITGSGDMDEMVMTDRNGVFGFSVVAGGDYTVQPRYDVDVDLAEVSTTDIVAITGQILGTNAFTNNYNFLAADVNFDQRIDVLDIVSIRRTILGLEDNFSHGQTWSFVPADVDVSNPFTETFPNVYNVNDLVGNVLEADFIAIQMGHIEGIGRTATTLEVDDVQLEAGQTHVMTISAEALAGFQGTFELAAGLELVSADLEGEGAMNLNRAAEGLVAVAAGEATVNLEVRATEAGRLSDFVSFSDAITVREGVAQNGNGGALSLNFSGLVAAELGNALEQNKPNPVVDVTKIDFSLATAGEVTLSVQDVQGRTVLVRNLDGVAGANQVVLNVSELKGATGVLSYTLVAGDFSATKKMVVVR